MIFNLQEHRNRNSAMLRAKSISKMEFTEEQAFLRFPRLYYLISEEEFNSDRSIRKTVKSISFLKR